MRLWKMGKEFRLRNMSNFILTMQDIEMQTGLTRKYIDRCYARFGSSFPIKIVNYSVNSQ